MPDPIKKGSLRDISFAKVYYAIAGHGRTGVLDIVGKPLHGPEKWHVHVW